MSSTAHSGPVIVDCDPGHDDAFALWLALAHLDLRAVTTTHGNGTLDRTTANAQRVLELVGSRVPVHAGADRPLDGRPVARAEEVHGETGLDGSGLPDPAGRPAETTAVEAILSLSRSERLHLVAIGPLTNVAAALAADPGLTRRLDGITVMGGSSAAGNVTPVAEFNIACDPEAAAAVFAAPVPVRMVGLNLTRQTACDQATIERLRSSGSVVGPVAGRLLDFYGERISALAASDPVIHDPCAVAWLIDPSLIESRSTTVTVATSGLARGMTICDFRPSVTDGPTEVAMSIDVEGFVDLLAEALASHG